MDYKLAEKQRTFHKKFKFLLWVIKMSWFKKIFSSQSSSQSSLQSSLQEPKIYFTKQKNQTEEPDKELSI